MRLRVDLLNLFHVIALAAITETKITDDGQQFDMELRQDILSILNGNETRNSLRPGVLKGFENKQGSSQRACTCAEGSCKCCTGAILYFFTINVRNRVCSVFTYEPDDFSLGVRVQLNDKVFYTNRVSGKNPPPLCLPIPRLTNLRVCIRFNNVYFIERNIHACVVLETQWNKETAFTFNFDCIRMGQNGFAVVRPEDGGGLPIPTPSSSPDEIEDYDEVITDKPPKKGKKRTTTEKVPTKQQGLLHRQ